MNNKLLKLVLGIFKRNPRSRAMPAVQTPPSGETEPSPDAWMVDLCKAEEKILRASKDGMDGRPLREFVRDSLDCVMLNNGAESIEAKGVPFDGRFHRPAEIGCIPGPGAWVENVLIPGLKVGDRVLKRAKVAVSEGKES